MPKINIGYQSLFEYLVVKDFPFARKLDEKFYPDENSRVRYISEAAYGRRWNPRPHPLQQLLGGLQPLADMGKDFVDTFKPYKSAYHAKRDALQPIRGLGNIARAMGNVIFAPMIFLFNTVRYAFCSGSFRNFAKNMVMNSDRAASWLLDGYSSLVRGSTQIASSPLTFLVKIPLRRRLTAIQGEPNIEQNSGIQKLVSEAKDVVERAKSEKLLSVDGLSTSYVEHVDGIRDELHRKYEKALARGQRTNIPKAQENKLFNRQHFKYGASYEVPLRQDRAAAALQYIGLFSVISAEQEKSLVAKEVASTGYTSMEAYEASLKSAISP